MKLDLDKLEAVARANKKHGLIGMSAVNRWCYHFDPPTVLALIARIRELEVNCVECTDCRVELLPGGADCYEPLCCSCYGKRLP